VTATADHRRVLDRVAIIGAGPCGLGCARELDRLGFREWAVYEREDHAGGLASSVLDPVGFTWDLGGHVVFSHFGEFDLLLDEVMGDDVCEHERASYIRFGDRWVPYPFQNNLRHLEPELVVECLLGLIEAPGGSLDMDFGSWMETTFGAGITRLFMRPYNAKVWATPAEEMASAWIGERVSVVDYRRALRNVLLGRDDLGWGPNNTFRFPSTGGTGEIYRRVASELGPRIHLGRELMRVEPDRKILHFTDGGTEGYDALVTTMPLDRLVDALAGAPRELAEAAEALRHTSVCIVGVGYERALADDKCWMYFPDSGIPFYRATNFAKYAASNVPDGDTTRFSSYLAETAFAPDVGRPADVGERVVRGLVTGDVVEDDQCIASLHIIDVDYAYPVPTLSRDRALATIQPWLMERDIYARGRFGAWRYEIGNMDHAVKMGIDVAHRLLEDRPEELWSL
jgi:protoporphyrinogen oxidase